MAPEPSPCPHCGAGGATGRLFPACGNRIAGRPRGPLLRWTAAVLVALVAAPLLLASMVLSLCGAMATVGGLADPLSAGVMILAGPVCIVVGVGLGRLAAWRMRTAEAETAGQAVTRFGRRAP